MKAKSRLDRVPWEHARMAWFDEINWSPPEASVDLYAMRAEFAHPREDAVRMFGA